MQNLVHDIDFGFHEVMTCQKLRQMAIPLGVYKILYKWQGAYIKYNDYYISIGIAWLGQDYGRM